MLALMLCRGMKQGYLFGDAGLVNIWLVKRLIGETQERKSTVCLSSVPRRG